MKRRLTILALTTLAVVALYTVFLTVPSPAYAGGATQISGIGDFDSLDDPECTELGDADFANVISGDLKGCLYVFVDPDTRGCTPGGAYNEVGTETFIGYYDGKHGMFDTTYRFTAKYKSYDDCLAFTNQQVGRCQHPIVEGSGEGVFDGVTGRLHFTDDVDAGNFPYKGHLKGL